MSSSSSSCAAAAAAAPSSQQAFQENLRRIFECPVSMEILHDAVTLVPCAHKISEKIAKEMFGEQISRDNWHISRPEQRCPLCRRIVEGYLIDHSMREMVHQLFQTDDRLPTQPLSIAPERREELPYPGKGARFVHEEGDWHPDGQVKPSGLCRCISFTSSTENSLLEKFKLLGYSDGLIAIRIYFQEEKAEDLRRYLNSFGIAISSLDALIGFSYIRDLTQIRTLFRIIAEHNDIPAEYFGRMRAIVEAGKTE